MNKTEILYGVNPVLEAIRAGRRRIKSIYVARNASREEVKRIMELGAGRGIRIEKANSEEVAGIAAGRKDTQGVACEADAFNYSGLDELVSVWKKSCGKALFVLLDGIEDPNNLGAIIRTAHLAGAHGVIIPRDRAAAVDPTVAKTSAGAVEHIRIARVTNLAETMRSLKEMGIWICGLSETSNTMWHEVDPGLDLAVVIGGEGRGMRRLTQENCDFKFRIHMAGEINSLNASVAAGIMLFEIVRKRLCEKTQG